MKTEKVDRYGRMVGDWNHFFTRGIIFIINSYVNVAKLVNAPVCNTVRWACPSWVRIPPFTFCGYKLSSQGIIDISATMEMFC